MLFARNQTLLAKVETDRGVDANPAAANAVKCGEVNPSIDGQNLQRFDVSTLSAQKEKLVNKRISFSIPVYLKGSGSAGVPPEIGPLLQACGNKETISAGVSTTYNPENSDSDMKSATIWLYKDGLLFKATGCMGNFTTDLAGGAYPTITFQVQGKLASITDAALVTGTYDTTDPEQVESLGLSFGAWDDAVCPQFGFSTGNTVNDRLDVNSADGLHSSFVGTRDPRWNATIEAVLEATHPFFGDFIDLDTVAIAWEIGSSAGNKITFSAPAATKAAPTLQNQNSVLMYGLAGQLLENTGEDNWSLAFT